MKLEKGVAYRCATEEIAECCLIQAKKLGWIKGSIYSYSAFWYADKENTCFLFDIDSDSVCGGSISDFRKYSIKVVDYIPEIESIEILISELLSKTVFLAEGQFIPRECVIEVLNKYGAEIKEGE